MNDTLTLSGTEQGTFTLMYLLDQILLPVDTVVQTLIKDALNS